MQISGLQIPWTFLIFALSVTFQAGATIHMLIQHGKDIKQIKVDIKANKDEMERRLYSKDSSMPIFVPCSQCDIHRLECKEARQNEYNHFADTLRGHGKLVQNMTDSFNNLLKGTRKKKEENNG